MTRMSGRGVDYQRARFRFVRTFVESRERIRSWVFAKRRRIGHFRSFQCVGEHPRFFRCWRLFRSLSYQRTECWNRWKRRWSDRHHREQIQLHRRNDQRVRRRGDRADFRREFRRRRRFRWNGGSYSRNDSREFRNDFGKRRGRNIHTRRVHFRNGRGRRSRRIRSRRGRRRERGSERYGRLKQCLRNRRGRRHGRKRFDIYGRRRVRRRARRFVRYLS